jgi:serine/threonine protein kinase
LTIVETMADEKSNNLEAGYLLGYYKIISLLGAGGMGEVYQAQDSRLRRRVALKVLPECHLVQAFLTILYCSTQYRCRCGLRGVKSVP